MADLLKSTAGNAKSIGMGTVGGAGAVAAKAGKQGLNAMEVVTDKSLGVVEGTFEKSMSMLDSAMPPEQREALTNSIKKWAGDNPALAIFALPQVVLTALPLFLFWLFTVLILVLSLVLGLLIALLITVIFIVLMLLIAVFVVLPIMFAAAFAGIFLSLWGLMIYKFVFPKLQMKEKAEAAKKEGQRLGVVGEDKPKRRRRAKSTVATEDGKKMDLPDVPREDPAHKFHAGAQKRKVKKKKKKVPQGEDGGSAEGNKEPVAA